MTDSDLLRQYALTGSEDAFSELVRRHIDMVYSVCLRRLRNPEDAEDATQAVFIALSAKVSSLPWGTVPAGWLYRAAGYAARDVARKTRRRKEHEMAAGARRQESPQPDPASPDVDSALARLGESERHAIVLRYLEGRSFRDVAGEMRLTEEAARKRVSRALRALRDLLRTADGPALSAVMVEQVLGAASQSAPPGLAHAATKAALAGWSKTTAGATLAKGAVLAMTLSKTKILLLVGGVFLLAGAGAVGTYYYQTHRGHDIVVLERPGQEAQVTQPDGELWKPRFYETYALKPGEDIKVVVPPLGWERQMFFMDDCRKKGGRGWALRTDERITLEYDGSEDHWQSIGLSPDLEAGLVHAAGVEIYQLDPSLPLKLSFPGDWVMRKGASTERRMAGLARIVSQKVGKPIRFEQRLAPREVLEVAGHYEADDRIVEMTDGLTKPPRQNFTQQGSLENFLDHLVMRLGVKLENHVDRRDVRVRWHDGAVSLGTMDALLRNLEAQTGLKLSHQTRDVKVWCMVEGAPDQTAADTK